MIDKNEARQRALEFHREATRLWAEAQAADLASNEALAHVLDTSGKPQDQETVDVLSEIVKGLHQRKRELFVAYQAHVWSHGRTVRMTVGGHVVTYPLVVEFCDLRGAEQLALALLKQVAFSEAAAQTANQPRFGVN